MKLYNDATSPFGRKVLVAAAERSIEIDEEFVDLNQSALDRWNPLRQIPVLVRDDGIAIYDSDVIMQFLDTLHEEAPLFPPSDRFGVLTRMALANGLLEATLLRRMEIVRLPEERSAGYIAKLEARIGRAVKALDAQLGALETTTRPLRADQITTACALGYVDFRYLETWRAEHPALAAWFATLASLPSMAIGHPLRTGPATREQFRRT